MSVNQRIIRPGWAVYTADERHIGQVKDQQPDYLEVEQGHLFGRDTSYFPSWAVGRVDEQAERVTLTITEDEVRQRDWSQRPSPDLARTERLDVGQAAGAVTTPLATTPTAEITPPPVTTTGTAAGAVETLDQPEVIVPVVEERLDITKQVVELGAVLIEREVTEEEQTLPVEVAHEEVRVERRPAQREATPEDLRLAAGEGLAQLEAGGTVIVPVIEEVVEIRKRMMVREELVITKQRVTEQHEVKEFVRRVEPRIQSSGRLERDVEPATEGTAT